MMMMLWFLLALLGFAIVEDEVVVMADRSPRKGRSAELEPASQDR